VKIVEAAELVSLHPLVEKRAQIGAPQLARDVADQHQLLTRRLQLVPHVTPCSEMSLHKAGYPRRPDFVL
jgi:hypothetical protein